MGLKNIGWIAPLLLIYSCGDSKSKAQETTSLELLIGAAVILFIALNLLKNKANVNLWVRKGLTNFLNLTKSITPAQNSDSFSGNSNQNSVDIDQQRQVPVYSNADTYMNNDDSKANKILQQKINEILNRLEVMESEIKALRSNMAQGLSVANNSGTSLSTSQMSDALAHIKAELSGHISEQTKLTYQENRENLARYVEKISTPMILEAIQKELPALVQAVAKRQQAAPAYVPPVSHTPSTAPIASKPESTGKPIPQSNVLYAAAPQGNLFHKVYDNFRAFETLYIIHLKTANAAEGTFDLVADQATLDHAFSMIDILRDACDLLGTNEPTAKTMRVVQPGKVEKQGGQWVIKDRLGLEW